MRKNLRPAWCALAVGLTDRPYIVIFTLCVLFVGANCVRPWTEFNPSGTAYAVPPPFTQGRLSPLQQERYRVATGQKRLLTIPVRIVRGHWPQKNPPRVFPGRCS